MRVADGTFAVVLACLFAILGHAGTAVAQDELQILSYPIGVVVGKIQVAVDLGSSGRPAELLLDGKKVCALTGRPATCTVDLGPDPHLHLLEAVRRSEDGTVYQRARRWLNRPGQAVELDLLTNRTRDGRSCQAALRWAHPSKLDPDSVTVTLDGWPLVATGPGYSYRFDCPTNQRSAVLTAYATFPDGRSAYAATAIGGFTGTTETPISAVALTTADATVRSCNDASLWPQGAIPAEDEGFDLAFVLDPAVAYNLLERSGRVGVHGRQPLPGLSPSQWLQTARELWYITPDSRLRQVDGFAEGRSSWLDVLFHVGRTQLKDADRIADAVAVAGKRVADGPHRRAVILLLGERPRRHDHGSFTPSQARGYLQELGVPLIVLRDGEPHDDGWGEGLQARTSVGLIDALRVVRRLVASQCVFWFEGDKRPEEFAAQARPPVILAGNASAVTVAQSGVTQAEAEAQLVQRSSEETSPAPPRAPQPQEETNPPVQPATGAQFAGRLNVTSVTVLVSARDSRGRPVTDLTPGELEVAEDGEPAQILGLRPVLVAASDSATDTATAPPAARRTATETSGTGPSEARAESAQEAEAEPLPVTIYVDPSLSGRTAVRQATAAIDSQLDRLVALGPVEVVFGSDPAQIRLAPTRDAVRLRQALNELTRKVPGPSEVERIRTQFIRDTSRLRHVTMGHDAAGAPGPSNLSLGGRLGTDEADPPPGMPGTTPGHQYRMAVRSSVGQEDVVVQHALRRISTWALGRAGQEPRLLLIVGAAFDEQPDAFYIPYLQQKEPPSVPLMRAELQESDHSEQVRRLGDELASAGWRVLAIGSTTSAIGQTASDSAEMAGDDRITAMTTHTDIGTTSTPGRLQLDPIASQTHLAEPSGGEAVVGVQGLAQALSGATGWYRLTYQVDRPADGKIHALDVRTNTPDVTLRTTSRVASTTTEGQAEARLAGLLDGNGRVGELPVRLRVEPVPSDTKGDSSANLEVTADLSPLRKLVGTGPLHLRVSVLVDLAQARSIGVHRTLDLPALPADGRFSYSVPLHWPTSEGRVAVSVEEVVTGTYGATTAQLTP